MTSLWTGGAYATLALTGGCGNVLMLLTLARDRPLRDIFGRHLRILLIVLSSVDLLYSIVGLPLYTLTIMYGEWSLWQNTEICRLVVVSVWLLNSTSKWYLLVLALTRLIATVWPLYFRAIVSHSNNWLALFIVMAPVCGSIVYTTSTLVGWAEMTSAHGQACTTQAVEGTGGIYYNLELFTYLALPLGLIAYIVIILKLKSATKKIANAAPEALEMNNLAAPAGGPVAQVTHNRVIAIKRTRVLAATFAFTLVTGGPCMFLWLTGMFYPLQAASPLLAHIISFSYVASGVINPIAYAIVSTDMHAALRRRLGGG